MNKSGFLLAEETLKIVIAVISISFLIFFLTSLYFVNINAQKLKAAEKTLERIGDIIKSLPEGKTEQQDIGPQGWYLFSFVENAKPNYCARQNCLCICEGVWFDSDPFGFVSDRQAKECSESGACLIASNLKPFEEIKNKSPKQGLTYISIKKEDDKISIEENKTGKTATAPI